MLDNKELSMPDVALSERGCDGAHIYNPRLRRLSDFVIKSTSIHFQDADVSEVNSILYS